MAGKVEQLLFSIFKSAGKGFGLQAEVPIEPGVSVLNEQPIAYVVCNRQREEKCAYCLGPASSYGAQVHQITRPSLRRCSKCKFVYYCGSICQKKDWNFHKQECRNIQQVQPKRPPDICLLASRLLSVLVKRKEKMRDEIPTATPVSLSIDQLMSKCKQLMADTQFDISGSRREMLLTFTVVLQRFVDPKLLEICGLPFSDLFGFLCWITCNCFNILDDDMNSVGIGIFEQSGFVNHSCMPNCVATFEGSNVSIRTIKPVLKGEEITISYIESIEGRDDRQNELQERYLFKCICPKCIDDAKINSLLAGKCPKSDCRESIFAGRNNATCNKCGYSDLTDGTYTALETQTEKLKRKLATLNENKCSSTIEALYDATIQASGFIPNDSIEMIKCNEALFDAFIENENWEKAIQTGTSLLDGYLCFYPNHHPVTGIHLFKLGKLELVLDHLCSGLEYLERCKKFFLISHGKEHRMTRYLLELIVKLEEEIIHMEKS